MITLKPEHIIDETAKRKILIRGIVFFLIVCIVVVTHYQLKYSPFFRPFRVEFQFNYPKGMKIFENRIFKSGSMKKWGIIWGESQEEFILIMWDPMLGNEEIGDNLVSFERLSNIKIVERGKKIISSINGHEMVYQTFTATGMNETLYCVGSSWICNNTEREFYFYTFSRSEGVQRIFDKYLEDFKCHIKKVP